jgi:endoglucanase
MSRPSGLTRRELLAAATAGAAAVAAGCEERDDGPDLTRSEPGPGGLYLRGVNSYSLNYTGGREGEPPASYVYLATKGHRIVRLPFEWAFVQPRLGGPLDDRFLRILDREVSAIGDAGMRAILDVHSGGRHPLALNARHRFGAGITEAHFDDVWLRISERFGGDHRIYAYDLMNEPFDLPGHVWQRFSQRVVSTLRAHGDRTLLWIEGEEWSLAGAWREHHPRPWIDDPIDNHAYSAHAYPGAAAQRPQQIASRKDARRFIADLRDFLAWLDRFGCRGSIGEVGWPSAQRVGGPAATEWNRLAHGWYKLADRRRLDVTYFGASSAYDNWLWAYDGGRNRTPPPGLRRPHSQAAVLEAHPTR